MTTTEARFWSHVQKGEGCWLWTGCRSAGGYGLVGFRGHRTYAHRVAFELAHGPLGAREVVRHRCDNPPCVNPEHLERGSYKDNIRDSIERGRFNSPKRAAYFARRRGQHRSHRATHCKKGHAWTTETTYIRPNGVRECRICVREAVSKYARKKKGRSAP